MTNPDRLRDLTDVQELIKRLPLAADFADRLPAYVQPKYRELFVSAQQSDEAE